MKVAGITMAYKDYWALSRWYAHHGKMVGRENLFVVCHGEDPKIAEICPGANLSVWPRDSFAQFDRRRGDMLNALQAKLLETYDWVFRTDADELLIVNPRLYPSLPKMLTRYEQHEVLTAQGFEVVALADDPTLGRLFERHKNIAFSGHYSKAVIERTPRPFRLHGVAVPPDQVGTFPHCIPPGFFLAHLKYANLDALAEMIAVRQAVGQSGDKGAPGKGWSDAEEDAMAFMTAFVKRPIIPWKRAFTKAHKMLTRKPTRLSKAGVVKTQALRLKTRTQVPKWFETI